MGAYSRSETVKPSGLSQAVHKFVPLRSGRLFNYWRLGVLWNWANIRRCFLPLFMNLPSSFQSLWRIDQMCRCCRHDLGGMNHAFVGCRHFALCHGLPGMEWSPNSAGCYSGLNCRCDPTDVTNIGRALAANARSLERGNKIAKWQVWRCLSAGALEACRDILCC